jgi:hypothetical protein
LIDRVFILNEDGVLPDDISQSRKITTISSPRPTYNDFFNLINQNTEAETISILANTDIYFDESVRILKYLNLKNKCFALTRWDFSEKGTATINTRRFDSQDVWIFKGKIKPIEGNFHLGRQACDSVIAGNISRAGYIITNPSLSIKSYHLHNSNLRNYKIDNLVTGKSKHLKISNINNLFLNLFYYFFHKKKYSKYIFTCKSDLFFYKTIIVEKYRPIKTKLKKRIKRIINDKK